MMSKIPFFIMWFLVATFCPESADSRPLLSHTSNKIFKDMLQKETTNYSESTDALPIHNLTKQEEKMVDTTSHISNKIFKDMLQKETTNYSESTDALPIHNLTKQEEKMVDTTSMSHNPMKVSITEVPSKTCKVYADAKSFDKAREFFKKNFLREDKPGLFMYIEVSYNHDLNHLSSNERNSLQQWLWILQKNFFFMQYPVDLDVLTYDIIASTFKENYVSVLIDRPELCNDTSYLANKVRNLLLEELFQNDTNSVLCNRNFENDINLKEFIYFMSMAWIGYDLDCSFFGDHSSKTSVKATATVWLVIICFILALCYPMLYKIVELNSIKEKIKLCISSDQIKNKKDILRQYIKSEVPFGFDRLILKTFYIYNFGKGERVVEIQSSAYIKFTIMFGILLASTSIYRFVVYEREIYRQYDYVYRVGFPIHIVRVHSILNLILYFLLLLVGMIMLLTAVLLFSRSQEKKTGSSNENNESDGLKANHNDDSIHDLCFFTARFIKKSLHVISRKYWDEEICFKKRPKPSQENDKDVSTVQRTSFIDVYIYPTCWSLGKLLLEIPSSICPFIWLIVFGTDEMTKYILDCRLSFDDKNRNCRRKSCRILLTLVVLPLFVISQWVVLSACVNLIRTGIYIIFVALTSSVHRLRILIVIITIIPYIGLFFAEFVEKYNTILNKMFEIQNELGYQNKECIQERKFDKMTNEFFQIKEGVFWIVFKIFLCACFFIISTIVLIKNNTFDDTHSDKIFKLAFIALTPKILFDFLEKKGNEHVKEIMNSKNEHVKEIMKTDYHPIPPNNCQACLLCPLCCFISCNCARHDKVDTDVNNGENTDNDGVGNADTKADIELPTINGDA